VVSLLPFRLSGMSQALHDTRRSQKACRGSIQFATQKKLAAQKSGGRYKTNSSKVM
jgi:hypothetical protein